MVKDGDVIDGKFRVLSPLGEGATGIVVAALHLELDEKVVLKLPRDGIADPRLVARFVREARNAARIKNRHVARFIDVSRQPDGRPYLVMEYLEGEDLGRLTRSGRQIRVADAVDYVLQTSEALAAAHVLGIFHRGLEPSNLFLTKASDGLPCIKVLNFGTSRTLNSQGVREDEGLTVANLALGSPQFLAPEQISQARDLDARTDIWALGAIFFTLLVRRPPFHADTKSEIVRKVLQDPPDSLRALRSNIPESLERVVLKCLEKDRDKRWQDVAELANALAPFGTSTTMDAPRRIADLLSVKESSSASSPAKSAPPSSLSPAAEDAEAATAIRDPADAKVIAPLVMPRGIFKTPDTGVKEQPSIAIRRKDGSFERVTPEALLRRKRDRQNQKRGMVVFGWVLAAGGLLLLLFWSRRVSVTVQVDPLTATVVSAAPPIAVAPPPRPAPVAIPIPIAPVNLAEIPETPPTRVAERPTPVEKPRTAELAPAPGPPRAPSKSSGAATRPSAPAEADPWGWNR